MTEEQQISIAVKLATIEQVITQTSSCVRRLEIRLLGSEGDPDSGIIAALGRKIAEQEITFNRKFAAQESEIRALQDDRLKLLALGAAALVVLRLMEAPIRKALGI